MAQRSMHLLHLLIFILTAGILSIFLAWNYSHESLLKGLISWLFGLAEALT
jgi:hypothetical protein